MARARQEGELAKPMIPEQSFSSLLAGLYGPQRRSAIILLSSILLVVTWWHLGSPKFYLEHYSDRTAPWGEAAKVAPACAFLTTLVLLGVIPALIVKFVLREKLADYGVGLGNRLRTVRSFVMVAPFLLLIAYLSSRSPAVVAEYPLNRVAGRSPADFGFHVATYLLLYLGWEFHFRGFLQYGLRESVGDVPAILIQTMGSTLGHLGKSAAETYAAVAAGLLFGVLAFRTRSLLSGLMLHTVLGVSLDYFICFGPR